MPALSNIRAASPLDASDDSRLLFTNDLSEILARDLDNMPGDFATMDSGLQITLEYRQQGRVDDTYALSVRIVNGTTILAAADSGGTFTTVNTNVINTADQTTTPTFAYVNTTADKTAWDGATIDLQQTYSQNMGKDGGHIEVDTILLVGTYTASGPTSHEGTMAVAGVGAVALEGQKSTFGSMSVAGTGSVTLEGERERLGSMTVAAQSSVTFEGQITSGEKTGTMAVAGTGTVAIEGQRERLGSMSVPGQSGVAIEGIRETFGSLTIPGASDLTISGQRETFATLPISAVSDVQATGVREALGSLMVAAVGTVALNGQRSGATDHFGTLTIPGVGTITILGVKQGRGPLAAVGGTPFVPSANPVSTDDVSSPLLR